MANNQKQNEQVVVEEVKQQVETPVQAEPQQAAPQVVVVTEQKPGIGGWLKKHWKGVTAAVTGTGAAVASAIVAYRKGKAAGMSSCVPQQEQEDYSLNPNE